MLVHAAAWEIQACSIDPVRAGGLIMALASHHNSMDQMIKQVSIKQVFLPLCLAVLLMAGCLHSPQEKLTTETDTIGVQGGMKRVFGEDAAFLQRHTDAILLRHGSAAVVVVPEYQGRVMTSTARGDQGPSSGWINRDVIREGVLPPARARGKLEDHMYAFGGEERFWMGPEGGQYSIFFEPGAPFEFQHWHTPDPIDTDPWKVVEKDARSILLTHDFSLRNHTGTRFEVGVRRSITLLDRDSMADLLGASLPPAVDAVGYTTDNMVTNRGGTAWEKDTGLLSIWLLCMFQPSDTTTVFVPYRQGAEAVLGPVVRSDYFGEVPSDRLKLHEKMILFRADGKARGKIGLVPERSLGLVGSYDPLGQHLTLLLYTPPVAHAGYVNSMWEMQEHPYRGDAINSYNDGPVDSEGEQMGPFYELESSSPALALEPGASAAHLQTIVHLYGSEGDLQAVLSGLLELDLEQIRTAF
jgi:hypothetical protein